MKLTPLADRVILKMVEVEETTKGGIILTASAKEKPSIAEVISVGPGGMVDGHDVVMTVKPGDKVITSKYSGTQVKLDGEELTVGIGKYGPYVRYGKSFASLAKTDDPYTITYDRAVEIVHAHKAAAAAANTPLKSFPEDPDMLVKNGRYGAYIAYKGKNYRLPKGAKPEELTLDECLKIVAGSKK